MGLFYFGSIGIGGIITVFKPNLLKERLRE